MKLTVELMDEAALRINDKFVKKYNELITDKEDYDTFIRNIKYELLKKINTNNKAEFNIDKHLNTLIQNRKKTKKRWLDNELTSNSLLQNKIQKQAAKLFKEDKEAFKQVYKVNTIDEFKCDMLNLQSKKNEKTLDWLKNDDEFLINFEYLMNKKTWQILQAFQSDLSFLILSYLKDNLSSNDAITMPIVMSDIPVDLGGRRKVSLDDLSCVTTLDNNKEEVYYHDIEEYKDLQINTYIGLDYVQKYCLNNAFKHFNATDKKIFGYILSKRTADFFETRQIVVEIGDIVSSIFETDGSKNYDTVRESIAKMANIKMQFIVKGLSGFISRIFTEVFFSEREVGDKTVFTTATIFVSDIIVKQLMEQQTMYIYGDMIDEISPEAFSLICALQGRRMKLYGEGINIIDDILPYSFFQIRFRMSDKRKKRNLPVIKRLLEEVKKKKIIIKEFEQIADDFHVIYYPLTAKEIAKFDEHEEHLYLLPAEG